MLQYDVSRSSIVIDILVVRVILKVCTLEY